MTEKKYTSNADKQKAYRARHRNGPSQPSRRSAEPEQRVTVRPIRECSRYLLLGNWGFGDQYALVVGTPLCPTNAGCMKCDFERLGENSGTTPED